MNRQDRALAAVRRLAALTAGVTVVLGLSACAGDDAAGETSGNSSEGSAGETSGEPSDGASSPTPASEDDDDAPGTDQSAALFEAYSAPEPVGTATWEGQTLEVFEVDSTAAGTRLAFQLSSPENDHADMDARNWSELPQLVDSAGELAYQPLTVTQPAYGNEDEQRLCLCTGQEAVGSGPRMQHILYEPLPDGVTSVDVTYGDFEPVTVSVEH